MSATKIPLVVLSLCAGLVGHSPTAAAASGRSRCDDRLGQLAATQQALDEMEHAVVVIGRDRKQLRAEAAALAATIAKRTRHGATAQQLAPLQQRRAQTVREVERLDARIVLLQGQLDALVLEVDRAERGYLACVEALAS